MGWRFAFMTSTSVMEFFIVKTEKMRLDAVRRPLKSVRTNGSSIDPNVTRPTSSQKEETVERS